MKKIILTHLILFLLFILLSFENLFAQPGLVIIPLNQQIEKSELIVEGKVISKESFWDSNHRNIYTKNTVEVYKVFKGQILAQIEIITLGGTVGLEAEKVTPSLQLSKNTIGVFLLNKSNIRLLNDKESFQKFRPYSGIQGFYKYNITTNTVSNIFKSYNDIEGVFYNSIKLVTKANYKKVSKKKIVGIGISNNVTKSLLVVGITNIFPTSISAGTKSILSINGTGFGTGIGKVEFSNADDGGGTLIEPLATQLISWSDTLIEVEVPAEVGTGVVRVTHQFNGTLDEANLSIPFSQTNVVSDDLSSGTFIAYQTQHINLNLVGGYTWQMQTGFNINTAAKESFIRAFDAWRCETGINWVLGTTTPVDNAVKDNINVISFDTVLNPLPDGTLGVNASYFNGCNVGGTTLEWFVSELDIIFDAESNWQFGPAIATAGQIDFESVAVHELGHAHQLGHVIDGSDILHFNIGSGITKRDLNANNITGGGDVQSRSTTNVVCGNGLMTNHSCSLSISDKELNANIKIYPNPNNGKFYIQKASFINLEKVIIFDINGRLISKHDISDRLNIKIINLNNISKGIYFLNIYSDTAVITKKIILK